MRRGLMLNLVSNIVFFVAGYVIHFFLGHTMPAASYGIVGTVMTVLDFEYMFLSNGARQSLAKEISMKRYAIGDVIRKTIAFQLILALAFFSLNFFGAPLLAAALNDVSLTRYFQIAAFLVPANSLFVLLLGITDGIQRFTTSATLNTIYPIAKLMVIPLILFVFADDPVAGMEVGYLLALLLCIVLGCISLFQHRDLLRREGGETIRFRNVATSMLSFSVFFIMASLVLSFDTLAVKSTVEPASMTGYYTGAVNFGKLSYYLMTAFFTMILPLVAKAVGEHDIAGAVRQVKDFLVLIMALILPIPVVISASSGTLLSVFYQPEYSAAAPALSCLSMSSFFMGMTVLLNMVYTNFASNRFSDILSIASLVIVIPLFVITAKFGGITAIATCSMTCTAITMLISLVAVMRKTGNIVTRRMMVAIIANVLLFAVTTLLFAWMPTIANLFVLAAVYAALYFVFVGIMLALRAVTLPRMRH